MQQDKLLIVDDSEANRLLLKFILEELGFEVNEAENGEKAVEWALEYDYKAIFMDLNMPVMNGSEATTILRNIGYDIPIFACSAEDDAERIEHSLASGFTAYLTKPIEYDAINNMLKQHISHDKNIKKNDEAFQQKLSNLSNRFVENIPTIINKINHSLKENSFTDLKRVAHKLKGTSSQFGFNIIEKISKDIEGAIKKEKLDIAIDKSHFLVGELKKIRQSKK